MNTQSLGKLVLTGSTRDVAKELLFDMLALEEKRKAALYTYKAPHLPGTTQAQRSEMARARWAERREAAFQRAAAAQAAHEEALARRKVELEQRLEAQRQAKERKAAKNARYLQNREKRRAENAARTSATKGKSGGGGDKRKGGR